MLLATEADRMHDFRNSAGVSSQRQSARKAVKLSVDVNFLGSPYCRLFESQLSMRSTRRWEWKASRSSQENEALFNVFPRILWRSYFLLTMSFIKPVIFRVNFVNFSLMIRFSIADVPIISIRWHLATRKNYSLYLLSSQFCIEISIIDWVQFERPSLLLHLFLANM